MNIDEVLLTKVEGWKACEDSNGDCMDKGYSCPDCPFLCKAAQLKLLEWLDKEGMLAHDSFGHTAYQQDGEWIEGELHSPNCRVCEFIAKSKEG